MQSTMQQLVQAIRQVQALGICENKSSLVVVATEPAHVDLLLFLGRGARHAGP